MSRLIAFLFLVFTIPHAVTGQVDSILSLPRNQQQEAIFQRFQGYEGEPAQRLAFMEAMADEMTTRGEKDYEEMIWSLTWIDKLHMLEDRRHETGHRFLELRIAEADRRKYPRAKAETIFWLGLGLFQITEFSKGMEMMMHSYEYLNRHGWTSPHMRASQLGELSKSYYHFGDYQNSIRYLHEMLRSGISPSSPGFPYHAVNTIGLCHLQLQNTDSAIHYFKLSHLHAESRKDSAWMALTTGNIGNAYYRDGRNAEALPYLETDYLQSRQHRMTGSAVNASTLLATIELQKGNIPKAEEYLAFAKEHIDTFLDPRLNYYECLFTYHKLKGEDQLAVLYADSSMILKKRKEQTRDRNILEQARMKAAYEEHGAQIKSLEQARHRQVLMRNTLFVILILSSLFAFFRISKVQQKRKAATVKLKEAEAELKEYVQSLLEKSEMIQSLREHIELQDANTIAAPDRSAEIAKLTQLNILTEEDWKHFRNLFDIVYPGFLVRLKETLGDLTPAETRLLFLAKLGISQKDMGDMLGISYNSIRMSRYRLRKKLNMPEEGTLEELVERL